MAVSGMTSLLNRCALTTGAIVASMAVTAPAALADILIDGSSTVFPITEAMAEDFGASTGTSVVVGVSGTGGGFKKFCAGETVISNASRPIKPSEMQVCAEAGIEYVEIPVAYDALTVVINPNNTWATEMSIDQLARLWSSEYTDEATTWADIDASWPAEEIELYGPGTDSGTFDYFVEEVLGKEGDSRSDYTASEDDNILVVGVQSDVNALGYFGLAYYAENSATLNAAAIDGGDGAVFPTPETVNNGTYSPFSRPIFIYVRKDALADTEVVSFVDYYIENAATISAEVGYVALPTEVYEIADALITNEEVGTVFRRDDGEELAGRDLVEVLGLSRALEVTAE